VLRAAVERTGLDDFGPGGFIERLALWLSEMDDDAERTGLGRAALWNDCVRAAANRLRIRALLNEHRRSSAWRSSARSSSWGSRARAPRIS